MLHKYANEDVSLGSWFIGLDVDHVDDRRMCCGTPPGMLFWFSSHHNLVIEKSRDTIDWSSPFSEALYMKLNNQWKTLHLNVLTVFEMLGYVKVLINYY